MILQVFNMFLYLLIVYCYLCTVVDAQTISSADSLPFNITEKTVDGDPNYVAPTFPILPFNKYSKNPILSPDPAKNFKSTNVYYLTAIVLNHTSSSSTVHKTPSKTSSIGLAWSTDRYDFTHLNRRIIYPAGALEMIGGCEDPCIVRINNLFHVAYTAFKNISAQLCTASSTDLLTWNESPPLFPGWMDVAYSDIDFPMPRMKHSKSGAIVSEPTANGLYHMYWGDSFFYHATSADLRVWTSSLPSSTLRDLSTPGRIT
jgi:predicted GH43/DUF377 family glycosyl hydrolase